MLPMFVSFLEFLSFACIKRVIVFSRYVDFFHNSEVDLLEPFFIIEFPD